ncbi:MAG: OmpA family protein, partial [Pseudomonadota bacterium]
EEKESSDAELAKKAKIRKHKIPLIKVGSFKFADSKTGNISKYPGMYDNKTFEGFLRRGIPEHTLSLLRNGKLPNGKKILLRGYADSTGVDKRSDENNALGKKRAEAVKKKFMDFTGAFSGAFVVMSGGQLKSKKKPTGKDPGDPSCRYVELEMWFEEPEV